MTKEKYIELVRKYVGDQPHNAIDSTWDFFQAHSLTDKQIEDELEIAGLEWSLGPIFVGKAPFSDTAKG